MKISVLVQELENAWKRIQSLNSDVPDAIILVGSGGRRAPSLYGHFAKEAWALGLQGKDTSDPELNEGLEAELVHEVLIVAEQLYRKPEEIFTTLLHEAVHGVAANRGIRDVAGVRHNRKFADLCEEVGLEPPEQPDKKIGWSAATLPAQTAALYQQEIEAIEKALEAVRLINGKKKETKKTTWLAACGCSRRIRLPKKTIDAVGGPNDLQIACGVCRMPFIVEEDDLISLQEM